jgi:hypothetical protein
MRAAKIDPDPFAAQPLCSLPVDQADEGHLYRQIGYG